MSPHGPHLQVAVTKRPVHRPVVDLVRGLQETNAVQEAVTTLGLRASRARCV